jgi:hypothetical protein
LAAGTYDVYLTATLDGIPQESNHVSITVTAYVPPLAAPQISCSVSSGDPGSPPYDISCSLVNASDYVGSDTIIWDLDGGSSGSGNSAGWTINDGDTHTVHLSVSRSGTSPVFTSQSGPAW